METLATEATIRSDFTLGYRKCLDGVRGLAILLVLLSHAYPDRLGGGFVGVDLFFVLSGFLITTLLYEEWRKTGGIRLKAFYVRRALRLLPALLLMLVVVVGVSAITEPPATAAALRKSSLIALFYSANWFVAYRAFPHPMLSPTWSLSVEEQFYLFWPVMLVLLLRSGASRGRIAGVLGAMIVLSAGVRAVQWLREGDWSRVFFAFHTRADGLLLGSLAGLALSWGWRPETARAKSAVTIAAGVGLGVIAIVAWRVWPGDGHLFLGGLLVINLAAAALLVALMVGSWAGLRAAFEFPPLVWLGRISYGAYLWHMATFWLMGLTGWRMGSPGPLAAVAASVALAGASFYLVERPLLRLKRRFAPGAV